MVDTINPNTGQPDLGGAAQQPAASTVPENRFYGGFDQPSETHINLADSQNTASPVPPAQTPPPQPVHDVSPLQPSEVQHTSYTNAAEAINWRGVMVIAIIGVVATIVTGVGIYFGVSAMNNSKLKEQTTDLEKIKAELVALEETPEALELPVTETPVVEEAPVVEAPLVTPTPIVIPAEQVPDDINKTAELG